MWALSMFWVEWCKSSQPYYLYSKCIRRSSWPTTYCNSDFLCSSTLSYATSRVMKRCSSLSLMCKNMMVVYLKKVVQNNKDARIMMDKMKSFLLLLPWQCVACWETASLKLMQGWGRRYQHWGVVIPNERNPDWWNIASSFSSKREKNQRANGWVNSILIFRIPLFMGLGYAQRWSWMPFSLCTYDGGKNRKMCECIYLVILSS